MNSQAWHGKIRTLGIAFSLFVMLIGFSMVMAPASAADVEISNETVSIDENTDSVYVDVNNTETSQANLTVEYVGLDEDGNVTGSLAERDLDVAAESTEIDKFSSELNSSETPEIRAVVTLDNTTVSEDAVSVETGTFQKTSGGGGGIDLGGFSNVELLIIFAVVGGGLLIVGKD